MVEKLKSRKLWVTMLSAALVVLGQELGMESVTQWIIGILASSYAIGQGVADAGKQGEVQAEMVKVESERRRRLLDFLRRKDEEEEAEFRKEYEAARIAANAG